MNQQPDVLAQQLSVAAQTTLPLATVQANWNTGENFAQKYAQAAFAAQNQLPLATVQANWTPSNMTQTQGDNGFVSYYATLNEGISPDLIAATAKGLVAPTQSSMEFAPPPGMANVTVGSTFTVPIGQLPTGKEELTPLKVSVSFPFSTNQASPQSTLLSSNAYSGSITEPFNPLGMGEALNFKTERVTEIKDNTLLRTQATEALWSEGVAGINYILGSNKPVFSTGLLGTTEFSPWSLLKESPVTGRAYETMVGFTASIPATAWAGTYMLGPLGLGEVVGSGGFTKSEVRPQVVAEYSSLLATVAVFSGVSKLIGSESASGIKAKSFSAFDSFFSPDTRVTFTSDVAKGAAREKVFEPVFTEKGILTQMNPEKPGLFKSEPQIITTRIIGAKNIEKLPSAIGTEKGIFTDITEGASVKIKRTFTTYPEGTTASSSIGSKTTGYSIKGDIYGQKGTVVDVAGELTEVKQNMIFIPKKGDAEFFKFTQSGTVQSGMSIPIKEYGVGNIKLLGMEGSALRFSTESVIGKTVKTPYMSVSTSNIPISEKGFTTFGIVKSTENKPLAMVEYFSKNEPKSIELMPEPRAYKVGGTRGGMKPMAVQVQVQDIPTVLKYVPETKTGTGVQIQKTGTQAFSLAGFKVADYDKPMQTETMTTKAMVSPSFKVSTIGGQFPSLKFEQPTALKEFVQPDISQRTYPQIGSGLKDFVGSSQKTYQPPGLDIGIKSYQPGGSKIYQPTGIDTGLKTFQPTGLKVYQPTDEGLKTYQPQPQAQKIYQPQDIGGKTIFDNPFPPVPIPGIDIPKIPPPGKPPGGGLGGLFPSDSGSDLFGKPGKRLKGKYQPSFIALTLGLKTTKAQGLKAEKSGIDIRGLIGSSKKK